MKANPRAASFVERKYGDTYISAKRKFHPWILDLIDLTGELSYWDWKNSWHVVFLVNDQLGEVGVRNKTNKTFVAF